MANYTHFEVINPPPSEWGDVMGLAYSYNASLVWLTNTDGTKTKAHGAFVILNGALIDGVITSLERTSADDATVYESITSLSYPVKTFLFTSAKDRLPNLLSGADTVTGYSGPDHLDGFAGPDVLKGGLGDDQYVVGAGDTVIENPNSGSDWIYTSLSQFTLPANVENLVNNGFAPIHAIGNSLDNALMSTGGNATLEGRDGEDGLFGFGDFNVLIGGKDNDTYHIDSTTNTIIETYDGGTGDKVLTNVSGVHLPDFVEVLSLFGQNGLTGYGNDAINQLHGTQWKDTLYGLGGADFLYDHGGDDTLVGGKGDDHYVISSDVNIVELPGEGTDTVEVNFDFTLGANIENLTFVQAFEHTGHGNELDNVLTGASQHDALYGHGGEDTLDGGAGADTMYGGAGNDRYKVDNIGDVVVELADEGGDGIFATTATYTLPDNVELLEFDNAIAHIGFGNNLENWLIGNLGKDTLFGLGGNDHLQGFGCGDQLVGGTGDDDYKIHAGDTVFELANEGIDTIHTNVSVYQLPENFENLETYGDVGFGNDADNILWGHGAELYGMKGNDTLIAHVGTNLLDGGEGDDTATNQSGFEDYAVQDLGDRIVVTNKYVNNTLLNMEHIQFKDGTINVNDGNPLFDTLYYMTHNLDVFHAGANALDHFNTNGWHEGRDPNAWFDTSGYLAVNKDVAMSGQNPLEHYHQTGWHEARDPSADFDTTLYLVNNPDVAASGVDPLEHFLQFGRGEGRVAYQAIGQSIVNGFDAEYYLLHNPDVAAAGADPLQHYNSMGWHEGRNPNGWFDTAGYLSHYSDVAASGANPLQHYEQFGWHEGRDPSAQFDTLKYLAANTDVAAAGVNPFDHFLSNGIYEGRSAMGDGLWH